MNESSNEELIQRFTQFTQFTHFIHFTQFIQINSIHSIHSIHSLQFTHFIQFTLYSIRILSAKCPIDKVHAAPQPHSSADPRCPFLEADAACNSGTFDTHFHYPQYAYNQPISPFLLNLIEILLHFGQPFRPTMSAIPRISTHTPNIIFVSWNSTTEDRHSEVNFPRIRPFS